MDNEALQREIEMEDVRIEELRATQRRMRMKGELARRGALY